MRAAMNAILNAILYLLRTGCPWRYLPRDAFPPRSTVYSQSVKSAEKGAVGIPWWVTTPASR